MKRLFKSLAVPAVSLGMIFFLCFTAVAAQPGDAVTILFTHDLHSYFFPAVDENGEEYGGFTRLMTAIREEKRKYPDALLLDSGDFSMGTLFQTAFATAATELRVMGAMGYDATTFGNHEYDYRDSGLASMLNAAVASGDKLPAIVEANYLPPRKGEEGYDKTAQDVWDAFENYGVSDYILLERGGVYFAVIGVIGVDAHECAPMSGMVFRDQEKVVRTAMAEAREECVARYGAEPLVIVLSHGGTEDGKGEDYELAKAVDGIDIIVSGHTHTNLEKPIVVNGTYIVSAGECGEHLGEIRVALDEDGRMKEGGLISYELIPIHDQLADDPEIVALVEEYKKEVEEDYLDGFGLKFDQVLANSPFAFESQDSMGQSQHESNLGNFISDAYKWAAEEALGESVDMAITAAGVVRASFPEGEITVSDVFDVASLGIGADGVPGYPLVSVWLTGADLKNVLEVDASIQPLMSAAQLYPSGVEYSYNKNRMIFNKVDYAAFRRADGTVEPIVDDELYRIVAGLYCGQMLATVEGKSFGLLTVTARDENGEPIDMERLEDYIVHDKDGKEVKEWHALAAYLQTMSGTVSGAYAQPDGRKVVYKSLNPVDLFRNANKFTLIAAVVVLLVVLILVLAIRATRRKNRVGRKGHPYRGKR